MRLGAAIPVLLVLGAVVVVVVIAIQRSMARGEDKGHGADLVAYLILALAMGVAGFALAELASTAFPGDRFVFDPAENLATSLSALVVSTPFLIYFWQRQSRRRALHPGSAGWAVYLSVIEIVFMTAFVISTVGLVNGLLSEEPVTTWTGTVVFGAIVVFHEYAARLTPPQTDAGELRRVVGSGIGLITAVVGLTGVLAALLGWVYEGLGGVTSFDTGLHPWVAMLIVGAPIWWYRWVQPWEAEPGVPRLTWAVVVSVAALTTALGAATALAVQVVVYLLADSPPAGQHFDTLPVTLALVLSGLPVWFLHQRDLREDGANPLRVYQYVMAAIALATAVSMAVALTVTALDRSLIVGAAASDIITLAVVLVAALSVWLLFERATRAPDIAPSWPKKLYTLGVGIVFGLVAAGALIATLFIVIRRLLDAAETEGLVYSVTIFVYTALAAWYLIQGYARDRVPTPAAEKVAPFDVTVVCSHPGPLANKFPDSARMRVWYRDDATGVVDESMADEIVATVANRASFVWVDEDGFRVAPRRRPD